ncbi:hypothetical protein PV336_16380 [Streptomyces sp. MI02-2A]|uniref:hypothetical protein n=1 Tax=Streptomyces sp. MI02-2A TaxID=3028688 RepID=UPI0029B3FAE1|nr:hypothetical protein [Streptomyces sp. MI02-2A]MDX3260799.1 hypothetical protein [Streptomyces sp. MI02-2A]
MHLGHLAVPKESAGQTWLNEQFAQREEAHVIVAQITKEWFPMLTDHVYDRFAAEVVAALDSR